MIVRLHIERLVLEGLPLGAHEGPRLQAAVETELGRLIGQGNFARQARRSSEVPLVRAEAIRLSGGAEGLGTQIGQAIFGGIGQ